MRRRRQREGKKEEREGEGEEKLFNNKVFPLELNFYAKNKHKYN